MPYQYVHKHCGGQISVWRMRCKKCSKQWHPISFMLTTKITPVYVESKKAPAKGAKWAEKLPVANTLVRFLPNWPRWARILTVVIVIAAVCAVIWVIKG